MSAAATATGGDRKLRVLVVDDHDVVHWGFRLMLGEQPWVERCLSARNGDEAMALTRRYDPHVALVDLFVGQESGAEICAQLLKLSPQLNVLLLSGAGRSSPAATRRRSRSSTCSSAASPAPRSASACARRRRSRACC